MLLQIDLPHEAYEHVQDVQLASKKEKGTGQYSLPAAVIKIILEHKKWADAKMDNQETN